MLIRKLAAGAALSVLALAATAAYAQEITGGVAGHVSENGKPVGGAQVQVRNNGTGVTVSTVSGPDGFYTVRNLQPGGPYTVTVTGPDNQSTSQTIDQVLIGAPFELDLSLGRAVSEVTVTAAPTAKNLTIATGPRSTFSARDIATIPSFARDLHDLVRMNPFVTVDEANSNALIVAGANNHFNTIYLDGVRQSDDFGLNNNGYPTQRSPFSLNTIESVNLEIAPYDVQYGGFQGGILNIVTKSGSNTFHGSAGYEYDSSAEAGAHIGVQTDPALGSTTARTNTTLFRDEDSEATLSGPLWKDHVFFFFGYERYASLGSSTFVPSDVAGANVVTGVTSAQVSQVQTILNTAAGSPIANIGTLVPGAVAGSTGYGYNPLNFGGGAPELNTDLFAKLDWYITDQQHLWVSYQQTDGSQYNTPDASTSSKGELNLQSADYNQEQNLTAYTVDLTSHWTNNLATEVEASYRDVESPTKLFTPEFSNFLVEIPTAAGGGEIDLGPDQSRQSNNLGVKDWQAKFKGHYTLGDHVITAGYEWEKLSEFDLFVQESHGDYVFNNTCGPGLGQADGELINLADHIACSLLYQNTASGNPNAAADTAIDYTNTVYAEDEWHATPDLTVTGGVRAEFYSSPSKPLFDPRFQAQYGFSNAGTINGENVVMPRVGFNWRPDPTLTVTGGFGLFSGGNPGVYAYDSFDTTGNLLGLVKYSCTAANCGQSAGTVQASALTTTGATAGTPALINVLGSSIAAPIQTDVTTSANFGTGNSNSLDPHFKPPADWKASLSVVKLLDFNDYSGDKYLKNLTWLGDGWRLHGDLILTKVENADEWVDLFEEQNELNAASAAALGIAGNGAAPDGRPLFNPNRYSQIVPGTGANGVPAEIRPAGAFDIELTDTHKGQGLLWAIGVDKKLTWGLDVDYTFTSQHVDDVTLAGASVASSNFKDNIVADPNNPSDSTSSYQILFENRVTVDFEHKFLDDLNSSIRLFFYNRAGLPFSYAFCTTSVSACVSGTNLANASGAPVEELYGQFEIGVTNQLLYVPKANAQGQVTATSDPLVTYSPSFNLAAFNSFLQSSGLIKYAGSIAPRNAFRSPDFNSGDVQFSQELPALFPNGAKGEVYFDIINFLNLLNPRWGIDSQVGFPYDFAPVTALNCQWSGLMFNKGTANQVTMPTCDGGRGNFYEYENFRSPQANNALALQTPANPPVATWVLKFGIRYKF
jgi:hypothetical protein